MRIQFEDPIDKSHFLMILEYEIAGSRWAGIINIEWVQNILAGHYARKARRKYNRWMRYKGYRSRIAKK